MEASTWIHRWAADFEDGYVCAFYFMRVGEWSNLIDYINRYEPTAYKWDVGIDLHVFCWATKIDPVSGLEYEVKRYLNPIVIGSTVYRTGAKRLPAYLIRANDDPRPANENDPINLAINSISTLHTSPPAGVWPKHDLADCLTIGELARR